MGLLKVKAKLEMLGIQVIEMNSFGLLYLTKDNGDYGLVLQDSNGTTKDIGYSFVDVEFGGYMIATGSKQYGYCRGLYIASSFDNLLDVLGDVTLTNKGNILTYRANLNYPFDKLVLAETYKTEEYFSYQLINYKGKRLKFKIPRDYLGGQFIGGRVEMVFTHSNSMITLFCYYDNIKRINLLSVDVELSKCEIINKEAVRMLG